MGKTPIRERQVSASGHRGTKCPQSSKPATKKKIEAELSKITDATLSPDDIGAFIVEMASIKNDRGVAILLSAHLEDALKFALIRRLEISEKFHSEIFGINASLSSFSNKVRFAHSINLISDETRKTIDLIRKIRNAFAHSKRPIFFTTEEIVDACSLFDVPIPLPPTTGQKEAEQTLEKMPPARQKFQNTCQIIMHNLFVVVGMYYPFPPQAPRTA